LVCGQDVLKLIQKKYKKFSGKAIVPDVGILGSPASKWKIKLLGDHNRQNIAYAVTVARILDVPETTIKKVVEGYKGVPGRLEFMKEIKGIKYYNDTTATTPEGCLAALIALKNEVINEGGIVLISGGTDKMLDFTAYAKEVPKMVKSLILFKGTATEKILKEFKIQSGKLRVGEETVIPATCPNGRTPSVGREAGIQVPLVVVDNMKDAIECSRGYATKGDVVVLSPGAASFGIFKNEFDRGEQFNIEIKK
jgi:UDP-N-acetylmuramoylalanine--D-glutamate ligase